MKFSNWKNDLLFYFTWKEKKSKHWDDTEKIWSNRKVNNLFFYGEENQLILPVGIQIYFKFAFQCKGIIYFFSNYNHRESVAKYFYNNYIFWKYIKLDIKSTLHSGV